jgi:hypothetical protein
LKLRTQLRPIIKSVYEIKDPLHRARAARPGMEKEAEQAASIPLQLVHNVGMPIDIEF